MDIQVISTSNAPNRLVHIPRQSKLEVSSFVLVKAQPIPQLAILWKAVSGLRRAR